MAEVPPIQGFLSYARKDDDEFNIVGPFVSKLKAFVLAKSGRRLDLFLDQLDIEWGAKWRDRLDVEVENALIFIPLLSANYLLSDHCRAEFLAFYRKARVLGVTELLLPVLLFESPLFIPDSADEVVQIAEARQWKSLEAAILAGAASPTYITIMADLASSLLVSLAKAEATIVDEQSRRVDEEDVDGDGCDDDDDEPGHGGGLGPEDPDSSDGPPGMAELMVDLQEAIDRMTEAANLLGPAIERLGSAMEAVEPLESDPPPRAVQGWALLLAKEFTEPAREIEAGGKSLFAAVSDVDTVIEGFRTFTAFADDSEMSGVVAEGLEGMFEQFGDMSEVEDSLNGLLDSLRSGELLSVPLRTALAPARRGLTRVTDSLRIIQSWQTPSEPARVRTTENGPASPSNDEPRRSPQPPRSPSKRTQPKRKTRKRR